MENTSNYAVRDAGSVDKGGEGNSSIYKTFWREGHSFNTRGNMRSDFAEYSNDSTAAMTQRKGIDPNA